MARKLKPVEKHHTFSAHGDDFNGGVSDVHVVGGGKRAYVWIGRRGVLNGIVTLSGPKFLRDFAKAILKEVGQ